MLEAMIKNGITHRLRRRMDPFRRHLRAHRRWFILRAHHGAERALSRHQSAYSGNITETQEELNAWVERVHRAGIQLNCHANGDVAIDMVLTAYERAQKAAPRPTRVPRSLTAR